MRMLKTKLYEVEEKKRQSEISSMRRIIVGSGDRSEKIRTYNFSQSRVTDHRIGLTLYKLEEILDGPLPTAASSCEWWWKAMVLSPPETFNIGPGRRRAADEG